MVKCTFAGVEIPRGQGIMYVKKDGKILYFLNSKSENNYLKLGRKAIHTKWTTKYMKGTSKKEEDSKNEQ